MKKVVMYVTNTSNWRHLNIYHHNLHYAQKVQYVDQVFDYSVKFEPCYKQPEVSIVVSSDVSSLLNFSHPSVFLHSSLVIIFSCKTGHSKVSNKIVGDVSHICPFDHYRVPGTTRSNQPIPIGHCLVLGLGNHTWAVLLIGLATNAWKSFSLCFICHTHDMLALYLPFPFFNVSNRNIHSGGRPILNCLIY